MLAAIEKDLCRHRAFHRLREDFEDGFPFEARLMWRDAMDQVFGGDGIFTLYHFEGKVDALERALRQRLRWNSDVVPHLIQCTRKSLKDVTETPANTCGVSSREWRPLAVASMRSCEVLLAFVPQPSQNA